MSKDRAKKVAKDVGKTSEISSSAKHSITKRIDAITAIPPERLKTLLPAPKSVKIEITGRCNYRCKFCALVTRPQQPTKDMDLLLFKRITAEMYVAGVKEIGVFYIGESFMCPQLLVEAIKWCKAIGFEYVFLTTNGSLATPEQVERCMKAGLDSLKFSLTTSDDKQFEEVIGVKAKMRHKAIANIKAARKVRDEGGYDCGLYGSWIAYDGEQGKRMEEAAEDLKPYLDEIYALPLYSFGSLAAKRESELGFKPTAGNQGRLGALREPLPCWCLFTEGHVTWDGRLTGCGFDAGTEVLNWDFGDLKQQEFMVAWNSGQAQALREANLKKDVTGTACETCAAYQ